MKTKLRDCVVCGDPVYEQKYQDSATARTCQPRCAQHLALKEHPELEPQRETRLRKLARLAGVN